MKRVEERLAETELKLQRSEEICKELEERLKQSDDEIQRVSVTPSSLKAAHGTLTDTITAGWRAQTEGCGETERAKRT
jgi:hypothetical protein